MTFAVILQISDGDELQAPFLRLLLEFRGAHHGAVFPHDLAAQAAFLQTGQPQQIDRRFCVAVAFQNAVRLCQKGKHMAGAPEILRTCPFFNAFHRGDGALCSGDTGGCGYMVDGDGKRRLMVIRIVGHHLREPELLDICGRHGHTDQPLGMGGHKIDVPSGCKLGCTDEIAFVLPVGIIYHDDDAPGFEILQRVFYLTEYPFGFLHFFPFVCSIVFFACISAAPSPTGGRKG